MTIATETPASSHIDEQKAQKRLIAEGVLAASQESVSGGMVLLAYALFLGANTFQIGLLSSAGMVGAILQLVVDALLRRLGSRKALGTLAISIVAVGRATLGLVPLLAMWMAAEYLAWGLLAGLVLVSGAAQIAEVVRISWIAGVVPEQSRGRFLGERQLVVQIIGSVIAVAASWLLDWQKAVSPLAALHTAQGYYFIAAALAIGSVIVLRTVPEPPLRMTNGGRTWGSLADPLRDPRFRPLLVYNVIWSMSVPFGAAFFNLYLVDVLAMPYGLASVINFTGNMASLYAIRLWGRLADRFGNRPVLTVCTIMKALFPLSFILASPAETAAGKTAVYLYMGFAFMLNVANSGMGIGTMNLALRLMPPGQQTSYLATQRMIANLILAIGPAIGGAVATALMALGWSDRWSISLLFVISGVGRFSSALYLRRHVDEPGAASVRHVWRVMKRVPGVLPGRGYGAMLRFWGKPVYDGFTMVRLGLGKLVDVLRGAPSDIG